MNEYNIMQKKTNIKPIIDKENNKPLKKGRYFKLVNDKEFDVVDGL
jgi:hypothetical protein